MLITKRDEGTPMRICGTIVRAVHAASIAMALLILACSPVLAQYPKYDAIMPPELTTVDDRQVDLASGILQWSSGDLSIGPEGSGLSHSLFSKGGYLFLTSLFANDSWSKAIVTGAPCPPNPNQTSLVMNCVSIDLGRSSATFILQSGVYKRVYTVSTGPAVLENSEDRLSMDGGRFVYTDRSGVRYFFGSTNFLGFYNATGKAYPLDEIVYPTGLTISLHYKIYNNRIRTQSVVSNNGFMLKYLYGAPIEAVASSPQASLNPSSIVALNRAIDDCDPMADACAFTRNWPTSTYQADVTARTLIVTDQNGLSTTITTNEYGLPNRMAIPGRTVNVAYGSPTSYNSAASRSLNPSPAWWINVNDVASVDINGSIWRYRKTPRVPPPSGPGSAESNVVTDPYNNPSTLGISHFNPNYDEYTWRPAPGSSFQKYRYSITNFPTWAQDFEQRIFTYTQDPRGNTTQTVVTPKPGSGLAPITTMTANYDATCAHPAKCNQPNWTRDAAGNTSNFEYDVLTGLVLRATRPADANGVRGVTRYAYVQRQAWIRNPAGGYVQTGRPITLLATEKSCLTSQTVGDGCAGGAADEVVTSYDYGPDSGPNNLLLRGRVAATGSQTLRWCYGHDVQGNTISETSPGAGLGACP